MWLGRPFEYRTFFSSVFRPPFEYQAIWQLDTNLPFEYWTSPSLVFRWLLYSDQPNTRHPKSKHLNFRTLCIWYLNGRTIWIIWIPDIIVWFTTNLCYFVLDFNQLCLKSRKIELKRSNIVKINSCFLFWPAFACLGMHLHGRKQLKNLKIVSKGTFFYQGHKTQ